ncbi:MAG: DNA primase [Acidiferrobacteraceae bacterium]|nr:DNA primase [Acidiferrobacteraceae bacterium]
MSQLPKDFIDELLVRIDIVEVIDQRVPLKKAGSLLKARCPFHDERTPSFTVYPTQQSYYCFGCSASGNAITFLREFGHLSFREAVEELAAGAGLDIPKNGSNPKIDRDIPGLLEIALEANRWFKDQLRNHSEAAKAVDYLKNRDITGETAAYFEIGYAPDGRSNIAHKMGTTEKRRNLLLKAGLIAKSERGNYYDRFRSRIIFPIHDNRHRLIGFGGRILGQGTPKYLNSPETAIFHKSSELYNLHRANSAIAKEGWSLVVEGYTDVISLVQNGFKNVVATLGTATTPTHIQRLFRLSPHIIFCYDGDRAGRDAAWKALAVTLSEMEEGRQASFLFLPDGEDPDSLVRSYGSEELHAKIRMATPLPDFLFGHLLQQTDRSRMDGRARIADLAQPLISKMPGGSLRELMETRLLELSGVRSRPESLIQKQTNKESQNLDQRLSPLATAISLLVQNPFLAREADLPNMEITETSESNPGWQLLTELHRISRDSPNLNTAALLARFQGMEHHRSLERLAIRELFIQDREIITYYLETMATIEQQALSSTITRLLREAGESGLSGDEKTQLAKLYKRREVLRSTRKNH